MRRLLSLVAVAATLVTGLTVTAQATTSAKVLTAASLTGPASGPFGSSVRLSGTVWRYGTSAKVAGAKVYLQRSPHGRNTWSNLRTAVSNSAGGYAFSVTQAGAFDYRARYYGSATFTGALSRVVYPVTTQKVLFDSIGTTDQWTGTVRATGRVYPAPPSRTPVYLYRWDGRKWTGVATGYTSGSAVTINTRRPASVAHYQLAIAARAPWGTGISAARTLNHYVWRGIFARPVLRTTGGGHHTVLTPAESPGRSRATLEALSRWHYGVVLNTTGCRRFVGAITPQEVAGMIGVLWDTAGRSVASGSIRQDSPPYQVRAELTASENELRLVIDNVADGYITVVVGADIKVLCNN